MLEIVGIMLDNVPVAAVAAVGAGFLRSLAGWIENAYKDGKVDEFEVKQLIGTVIKYFAGVSLLMLGLPVGEAVAGVFILDATTSALKNK